MTKYLLLAAVLLVPGLALAQSTAAPSLGQRTLRFYDAQRQRPVVTEVWYPTAAALPASTPGFSPFVRQPTVRDGALLPGTWPLIMLSHGTGGGRLTLEWLAQALAQHGFIVAAVDHWGNTYDNKIPQQFLRPWERPLDISFALTALLQDAHFGGAIDQRRMGAAGFSFGGYTVIALAGGVLDYEALIHYYQTVGHRELEIPELPGVARYLNDSTLTVAIRHLPPLQDKRLKAFLAISPALGAGFRDPSQFAQLDKPVYIIGSQSDSMAPVRTNARHYHRLIRRSGYFEFPGKTGHYVMLNEAAGELKKSEPTYFADDASVDRHRVHLQVDSLAVKFFNRSLKKADYR